MTSVHHVSHIPHGNESRSLVITEEKSNAEISDRNKRSACHSRRYLLWYSAGMDARPHAPER